MIPRLSRMGAWRLAVGVFVVGIASVFAIRALERDPIQEAIDGALAALLEGHTDEERTAAIEELVTYGHHLQVLFETIEEWGVFAALPKESFERILDGIGEEAAVHGAITTLRSTELPLAKVLAMRTLARFKADPRVVSEDLQLVLGDPEALVFLRCEAAECLGTMRARGAARVIARIILNTKEAPELRETCLLALAKLDLDTLEVVAERLFAQDDSSMCARAIRCLGETKRTGLLQQWAFAETSLLLRCALVRALAAAGGEREMATVEALARGSDVTVRVAALDGLTKETATYAENLVTEALLSNSKAVRLAAVGAALRVGPNPEQEALIAEIIRFDGEAAQYVYERSQRGGRP